MIKKSRLCLVSFAIASGLVSLSAQDSKQGIDKQKAKPQSAKTPSRGGHYLPPSERHLDELITKIRIAEEAGKKYSPPRPMTEPEREHARERRIKVEGAANFRDGVSGAESEYAVAIDPTGQNIVVGYNLFARDPNAVSSLGVAYSHDGGVTFQDGGFLPSPAGQTAPDGTLLPYVLSDPDVKWVPGGTGCNFIYSSIIEVAYPPTGIMTGTADTVGVHRSTDCGQTWQGPFEVKPVTNPNGGLTLGSAFDAADKEFMDVNVDTGRVMLSWSNFTSTRYNSGQVEVSVTFCDNIMSGNPPSWSPRTVINRNNTGFATGSVPRFGPSGPHDVYVAYSLSTGSATRNTQVVASHDGGVTWSAPVNTRSQDFAAMDDILGNDRVNEFPSLAVDTSTGPNRGAVYTVYSDNNSGDGSDVAFQASTDGGNTWTPVQYINARPGQDRGQWFPYITVDKNTGRVSVIFYDQSVQTTGDLVQVLMTFSDDGGTTWSAPSPLTARPFHAAYGNDSSAPNLGDYIGAVAQNGSLYAVWAGTPNSVLFTDGQPGFSMSIPTLFFKIFSGSPSPAVDLGAITSTDAVSADGFIHPGDTVSLNVGLRNPITNPLGAANLTGISAVLSSITDGVTLVSDTSSYVDLPPNSTTVNAVPYQFALSSDFVAGTPIEFALDVTSANGTVRRLFTQNTGAPIGTVIFSEDFESVPANGSLPNGWTISHAAGVNMIPWITNNSFCNATSNGLFHIDANDGLRLASAAGSYRWERAFSPIFNVPSDAQWVTIDFDICYDTEDDPNLPTAAYDGAFLRITDQTGAGHALRSIYADSFAETLTSSGTLLGYPKHLNDDRNASYFGDTSAWAGDSKGMQHVTMRLPGMAGSAAQLRFEYTQDWTGTCTDVRPTHTSCGVLIDNIVVRSVTSQ